MKKLGIISSLLALFGATSCDQEADHIINIQGDEVHQIIKNEKPIILDVRTAGEFNQGHLPKAKNIDFFSRDFSSKIQSLDKDKTYLLYCRSGNRSGKSLKHFKDFKKIYHLKRGYFTI
jgi:rhodanese-related sulfurtransferase